MKGLHNWRILSNGVLMAVVLKCITWKFFSLAHRRAQIHIFAYLVSIWWLSQLPAFVMTHCYNLTFLKDMVLIGSCGIILILFLSNFSLVEVIYKMFAFMKASKSNLCWWGNETVLCESPRWTGRVQANCLHLENWVICATWSMMSARLMVSMSCSISELGDSYFCVSILTPLSSRGHVIIFEISGAYSLSNCSSWRMSCLYGFIP